jgi:NADP-dependent 3-hydroxy acid dehydrogenase YdfG
MCFVGCDSGFGHELAKRLDTLGMTVFAGCLFPENVGAFELKLACSSRLHVLHLDVTMEEHVRNAVQYVKNSLGNKSKYNFEVNADKIPLREL